MLSLIAVSRDMQTDVNLFLRAFTLLSKLRNSQTGYWRPTVSPPSRVSPPRMHRFPLYSLYHSQRHTRNCDDSEKAVAASPQEEFANNRLLREFRNFSVKPRWRPVAKHWQNVWNTFNVHNGHTCALPCSYKKAIIIIIMTWRIRI